MSDTSLPAFQSLGLPDPLLRALQQVGYETPSPIQAECIPLLMDGHDLVGQAQTGTGKTAAFALPMLSRVDVKSKFTQVLVLAPTRELAIQVAEACQTYAKYLKDFHVLPIYGGQSYSTQLSRLKRGVQVVVGTPGRVMDHMRRGTLKLDRLNTLVLDEADEMLRMGFIDDVEWVLEHTPDDCQIALFSATMPKEIRKVAQNYLTNPKEIKIASKTTTASTIRQRYLSVNGREKLDAITRVLESEEFDGVIVFVRTKIATAELADKLSARGYAAEALNGDIPQDRREKIVDKLKKGKLDILVATDVVARGLDVERISHVINYDIPTDTEAYVHRIGRTGRAGREGDAILFVTGRERRMLKAIERTAGRTIDKMQLPGAKMINENRIAQFKKQISDTLTNANLDIYRQLIDEFMLENEVEGRDAAAALAHLFRGNQPLLLDVNADKPHERKSRDTNSEKPRSIKANALKDFPDVEMRRYRLDVGHIHKVKPGNIVGAIANEAEIDSNYIGDINIYEDFTTVDLPDGMPSETFKLLKEVRVCQRKLAIRALKDEDRESVKDSSGNKRRKSRSKKKPDNNAKPRKRVKKDNKKSGKKDVN